MNLGCEASSPRNDFVKNDFLYLDLLMNRGIRFVILSLIKLFSYLLQSSIT